MVLDQPVVEICWLAGLSHGILENASRDCLGPTCGRDILVVFLPDQDEVLYCILPDRSRTKIDSFPSQHQVSDGMSEYLLPHIESVIISRVLVYYRASSGSHLLQLSIKFVCFPFQSSRCDIFTKFNYINKLYKKCNI